MKTSPNNNSRPSRLLLLLRHGKAAPKDKGLSDFERILTPAGIDECDNTSVALKKLSLSIDLMISSPADRALETAHRFAQRLEYPHRSIRIADILYTAGSIRPLVAEIRRLDDFSRTVAMCGHNPSIDLLAAHFVANFSRTIPKGAAVGIAFDATSWSEVVKGSGRLQFFLPSSQRSTAPRRRARPQPR